MGNEKEEIHVFVKKSNKEQKGLEKKLIEEREQLKGQNNRVCCTAEDSRAFKLTSALFKYERG